MNGRSRKRLIDVAFPLEEVSAHSRQENKVRHGRISALHTWWARRPPSRLSRLHLRITRR